MSETPGAGSAEPASERLLKDTWAELAAEGTSICGVTLDWEKVLPVADEYALVMGDQLCRYPADGPPDVGDVKRGRQCAISEWACLP